MIPDERQLSKLTIEPYQDQEFSKRAGDPWYALFNPSELSVSRKNNYRNTASAGASAPQTSYGSGDPEQVQIDLLLDGTGVIESTQSVGERLDALLAFAEFQPDTHQPFYLHAFWGRFDFRGVLTQANISYKLFDRNGEPLRATVQITLQEIVAPEELNNRERLQSPDLYQSWMVREGESLDAIAHRIYGSPRYWRALAEANQLANPRQLEVGAVLTLPPLDKGPSAEGRGEGRSAA